MILIFQVSLHFHVFPIIRQAGYLSTPRMSGFAGWYLMVDTVSGSIQWPVILLSQNGVIVLVQ